LDVKKIPCLDLSRLEFVSLDGPGIGRNNTLGAVFTQGFFAGFRSEFIWQSGSSQKIKADKVV